MSSERVTLQLYLGEIVELISGGIMSSSWSSKRKVLMMFLMFTPKVHENLTICSFPPCTLAAGILSCFQSYIILFMYLMQAAQAVSKLCDTLGEVVSSQYHVLLSALLKEIPGRLWEVGVSTFIFLFPWANWHYFFSFALSQFIRQDFNFGMFQDLIT